MGGFGVWQTAITYPDKFAAAVAVAGGVEAVGVVRPEDLAIAFASGDSRGNEPDRFKAYAEGLKTLPVWHVHGEKDDGVPVEQSRKMVAA